MSAQRLETLLARLYTDAAFRARFLADPDAVARAGGLDEGEVRAVRAIDRDGLAFACASFAHKRDAHGGVRGGLCAALARLFGRRR